MEVLITIWGTPKWANGGKTPNFLPTADERPDRLLARRRVSATRAASPAIRSCASTRSGTSRTCSSSWRRSSTRRAGRSGRATTRSSPPPPTPGSRQATATAKVAVGSTSSAGRDKVLEGQVGDPLARPLRAARRRREPAAEVRRVGAAPVSRAGAHEADAEGEVAERHALVVPALRDSRSTSGSSARTSASGSPSTATR